MKQFLQSLYTVALRDLRDNFWMWAVVIAVVCGSYEIAIGFCIFAFYDKLNSILEQLRDGGQRITINVEEQQ